jgi:uncharacterized protein (DUF1800 family)
VTFLAAVGLTSCTQARIGDTTTSTPDARVPQPAKARQLTPHIVLPSSSLTEDHQILHVLDRLGYGPRPGDLERVTRMGLARYIEQQLDGASSPEPQVEDALHAYPALAMSTAELVRAYTPAPQDAASREASNTAPGPATDSASAPRRPFMITGEMQAAKVVRAVLSDHQLQEVMVDFWFNHFNVFASSDRVVRLTLPAYEREAIRRHALGRFRDLLLATAQQPAMLVYLDNWLSSRSGFVMPTGPHMGRKLGPNENYARELMELHTLGVDGGYTQHDVIEVSRCFTGWTIDHPEQGGEFLFRPEAHDDGEKWVLGHLIPAGGGRADGLRVIDILARHPSTARFISTKLVRRFVADDPPPALVERAARTFQHTDGDIRAMLATIFTSPEFFSPAAYRSKIKTPLELVASAVRATGALIGHSPPGAAPDGGFVLAQQVARLGEPLYEAAVPTGYDDTAEAWISAGSLLNRMNFALALARNHLAGVRVSLEALGADPHGAEPGQALDRLLAAVLHGQMAPETRATLEAHVDTGDLQKLTGLILATPEFQRR